MYKQKIDDILAQEISRQEFLKASGALVLTLLGLPALIASVTKLFGPQPKHKPLAQSQASGYGGRAYGK